MKPKHSISRYVGILLLALLAACQTTPTQADPNQGEAAVKRAQDGKALWEEKCRTVAGEKIYRKVDGVEEVLLMKVSLDTDQPPPDLVPGDKRIGAIDPTWLTTGNLHASRFTTTEATKFALQWRVVEHISNTTTGFSGTLFIANRDDPATGTKKDDLVLSFRSTEFIDDAARDNEATNKLEIKDKGFAFGQIADRSDRPIGDRPRFRDRDGNRLGRR